jgi:hypothetical protein
MTLAPILTALENTGWATAIREGSFFFPIIETLHVVAITAVVGGISIVDLRLLGVLAHHRRVSRLTGELLPLTWGAFALAVVTGSLLFASAAVRYAGNSAFQLKFVILLLAGLNMAAFHAGAFRKVEAWDEAQRTPAGARLAGAASLVLWIGVVAAGRFIGFTDPAGP